MQNLFSNLEYKILEIDCDQYDTVDINLDNLQTNRIDCFLISDNVWFLPDFLFSSSINQTKSVCQFLDIFVPDHKKFVCIVMSSYVRNSNEWKYLKKMCLDSFIITRNLGIRYVNYLYKNREPPFYIQIKHGEEVLLKFENVKAGIDYVNWQIQLQNKNMSSKWNPKTGMKAYCKQILTKYTCLISFKYCEQHLPIIVDECYAYLRESSLERFEYIVQHYALDCFEVLKLVLPIDFNGDKFAICCKFYGEKIHRWEEFKYIIFENENNYTERFWELAMDCNQIYFDTSNKKKVLALMVNSKFCLCHRALIDEMYNNTFLTHIKFLPHTKHLFRYYAEFKTVFMALRRTFSKDICWIVGGYLWEKLK